MNERIFELAKQADLIQWDTLSSGARTPDHESVVKARKFAELIVRECARACGYDEVPKMIDPLTAEQHALIAQGRHTAAYLVKQHFGVEE